MTLVLRRLAAAALLLPWVTGLAPVSWTDSFLTRVEILALIETLNARLLSNPSATATLERWCAEHGLAKDARIVARLLRDEEKSLSEEDRNHLALSSSDSVRYRHVRLFCGDRLLSEADNWYVPQRLTPEMNRLLDETATPFGRAVSALAFRRETLSAEHLWSPLPEGWERGRVLPTGPRIEPPEFVLRHHALLRTAENVPFSVLTETYTRDVLAFPLPAE